jgi:hypothetical protein
MNKIKVTSGLGSALYDLNIDNLYNLCLELAGGGFSVSQTTEAMILRSQLEKGEKVKKGKYTVEIVEV